MRWEPLHELVWQGRTSRLHGADSSGWAPATDVYETSDAFCIAIELPGFRPGEFDVQATDESVTISGRRDSSGVSGQFIHVERGQGAFVRRFRFAQAIVSAEIFATFREGLLAVRVPKRPRPEPQRVTIES